MADAPIVDRTEALVPLLAAVRGCRLCAEALPLPPAPLFQLDARARILIAGQAPGRRAQLSGLPFDDVSGERLRGWLGVDRAQFYDARLFAIVPMALCFPGSGAGGDLAPPPLCAATWRRRLLAQLPQLQLTLALGRHAVDWHLPDARGSLTERVAQWPQHWPRLLPMPHPSPRNQRWLRRNPWFESTVLPALRAQVQALLRG